jgi:hypothetical protein
MTAFTEYLGRITTGNNNHSTDLSILQPLYCGTLTVVYLQRRYCVTVSNNGDYYSYVVLTLMPAGYRPTISI